MITLECDGCYKRINLINGAPPAGVTTYLITVNQRPVANYHLCEKCATKKQSFYMDNPNYVPPSEDAESEKKAAQGS